MDSTDELLLTVLALSQEGYRGPLSHALPPRLKSALRKAQKKGWVYVDDSGPYLEEEGSAELEKRFRGTPFVIARRLQTRHSRSR